MKNRKVYRELQKHLDSMPVGFPASIKTDADIKLLKHIFTPEEAQVTCFLTYKPETVITIFDRIKYHAANIEINKNIALFISVESPENLEFILDKIQKKGGIESKIKNGVRYYYNAPLIVGIYEMQVNRLTPKFLENFSEYNSDINFGLDFLSLKKPQMRVVPIHKTINSIQNVSHFDHIITLFEKAKPPFVVLDCICRKKSNIKGEPCKVTDRKETCIAAGDFATTPLLMGIGREISKKEAVSIIEQNQKDGLVLQPSNTEELEFVCSCCGCCCGMLNIHKKLPIPIEFWASNFHVTIDKTLCNGCGVCEKRCQVGAVKLITVLPYKETSNCIRAKDDKDTKTCCKAVVDLNRCLGCGLCVPTCSKKAISLVKKENELKPPLNREELYELIILDKYGVSPFVGEKMSRIKQISRLNSMIKRVKVLGKLVLGVIKTGKMDLIRR